MSTDPEQADLAARAVRRLPRRRVRAIWPAVLAALGAVSMLAGCGSSAAGHTASAASLTRVCTQVASMLADGPDPDADPVGYAEAQIQPLRAVATSDQALQTAVHALAGAYAQVFASNGASSQAKQAVAAASRKVDAICPGATS
jgi:hypothetical protein